MRRPGPVRWGVVLCTPDDGRVVKKMVCFNEKNATLQGRDWKRRHPDHLVRVFSLMPGDTSGPVEIALVPTFQFPVRSS